MIYEKVLAGDYLNVSISIEKEDLSEISKGEEITVDIYYEIFKPIRGKFRENFWIVQHHKVPRI